MEKKTLIVTVDEKSSYVGVMPALGSRYDTITITKPVSVTPLDGYPTLYKPEALEEARQDGQNEAWELARKIITAPIKGGYTHADLKDIFGLDYVSGCFEANSYREAVDKVQQWEEKKANTIHVGDVLLSPANTKALVTCIMPGYIYLVYSDGSCNRVPLENINELYKKTGQSFDPSALLDKLKEEK